MWFGSQIQIKLKPTPARLYIQYRGTILPPRAGRRWRGAPLDLEISSSRRAHRLRVLAPSLLSHFRQLKAEEEMNNVVVTKVGQKMNAAHSSSLNASLETPSQANLRQCFPPDKAAFQCRDVTVWPSQRTRET